MCERCKKEFECKGECWVNAGGSFEAWDIISRHCDGKNSTAELIGKALHEWSDDKYKIELCKKLEIDGKEKNFLIEEGLMP